MRLKKNGDAMLWDDGSGRRDEGEEKRLSVAARLPKSLHEYVTTLHGKGHGAITRALEDVIRLHRHLHDRLAGERKRVQQFALDEGLNWPGQAPEVFARLIIRGLDAAKK